MYTHPNESTLHTIAAVLGGLIWAGLILGTMGIVFVALAPVALMLWIGEKLLSAHLYGNAVAVSEHQYPELHKMTVEISQQLGLQQLPRVFLLNADGARNALAVKFLSKKYVILYSDLVDVLCEKGSIAELRFVLGHELAHHAKGHLNFWKNLLIAPARMIAPLGMALSRARELTADGVGMVVAGNPGASANALMMLAGATKKLPSNANINAFVAQEQQIGGLVGWYLEFYSSHPRMTRRVQHLIQIYPQLQQHMRPSSVAEQRAA